jgi:hypothetical protein
MFAALLCPCRGAFAAGGPVRAAGIDGVVLMPDGKPAVKAIVALAVPGSRTRIQNGAIDTRASDVEITVPAGTANDTAKPIDLGEITLDKEL